MLVRPFILCIALILGACSSQYPNQDITGKSFPKIKGKTLTNQTMEMPQAFAGKPTLLLIGYKQDSQFDIDRWLIALDMTETNIDVYELPAIQGMFPRMFKTQINDGMRRGIPKELWQGVVTIYEDGERVQQLTGNVFPNNARVLLLDASATIVYFYDRGFSVTALNDVRDNIKNLKKQR